MNKNSIIKNNNKNNIKEDNNNNKDEVWYNTLYLLLGVTLFRSFLIPTVFQLQRIFNNPLYSSGNCLLKLVNETTPYEFTLHPFYKSSHFDNDCNLDEFVRSQYHNHEAKYFTLFLFSLITSVIIAFFYEYKKILTFRYLIILLVGYHLQFLQHCYMHFGQDVIFLAGNVMHHADITKYKYGASEFYVDTTPDGVVLTVVVSALWSLITRSLIIYLDPELRSYLDWKALFVTTGSAGVYCSMLAKYSHTVWHSSATIEMKDALPFTNDYFAYQHVFVHHQTGESFGPSPIFDPIFSYLLTFYGYLHNIVFKIQVPSYEHYFFSITFDFFIGLFVILGFWSILRFAKFLDNILSKALKLISNNNDNNNIENKNIDNKMKIN